MVKCSKAQIRQLKTALRWEIPAAQRQRIQMVLLRESGMAQPAIGHGCLAEYGPGAHGPMTTAGSKRSSPRRAADASARTWR